MFARLGNIRGFLDMSACKSEIGLQKSQARLFEICGYRKGKNFVGPNEAEVQEAVKILEENPKLATLTEIYRKTPLHVLATNFNAFDFENKIYGQRGRTERLIGALVKSGARISDFDDSGTRVDSAVHDASDELEEPKVKDDSGEYKANIITRIIKNITREVERSAPGTDFSGSYAVDIVSDSKKMEI